MRGVNEYIFSRFFKHEPSEICRHLSEKNQKTGFFAPEKLQKHTRNEKERTKKKERRGRKKAKKKKQRLVFAQKKKDSDGRGLFDSNVFNNQARSLHMSKFVKTW